MNFTKIEIDRKIGALTHLREYAESLALIKLKMYTRYFHEYHKTLGQLCLAIQISMWLSMSVLSVFGAFPCLEENN